MLECFLLGISYVNMCMYILSAIADSTRTHFVHVLRLFLFKKKRLLCHRKHGYNGVCRVSKSAIKLMDEETQYNIDNVINNYIPVYANYICILNFLFGRLFLCHNFNCN